MSKYACKDCNLVLPHREMVHKDCSSFCPKCWDKKVNISHNEALSDHFAQQEELRYQSKMLRILQGLVSAEILREAEQKTFQIYGNTILSDLPWAEFKLQ